MGIFSSRMATIDASIEEFVKAQIAENKVMVFSKSSCPFCIKAKKALKSITDDFKVLELDQGVNVVEIQDVLMKITGGRSVPRVFIGGKFFGGGDDTAAAAANGSLKPLLIEAGVQC